MSRMVCERFRVLSQGFHVFVQQSGRGQAAKGVPFGMVGRLISVWSVCAFSAASHLFGTC